MNFVFDIRKSVAAASFLCEMSGGEIEVRELLKMLYAADREAILSWHRSITGDQIFSMPYGMVLSRLYNLINYGVRGSDMDAWKRAFSARKGNCIAFQENMQPNFGPLSEREERVLTEGFNKIRDLISRHGQDYIEVLHKMWPEWSNPNGSSILVEPDALLIQNGEDKEAIREISADLAALNSAKLALQAK